jgi:hypothetical protein
MASNLYRRVATLERRQSWFMGAAAAGSAILTSITEYLFFHPGK